MFKKITILLSSLFAMTKANPTGIFCDNVILNELSLNLSISKNNANISAIVFGNHIHCTNEKYNYTSTNNIEFSKEPSDCLNKYLIDWGGCPCPPKVIYKNNTIQIYGTPIGQITLKSCN